VAVMAAACKPALDPVEPASNVKRRIVSLDYCADQFVLKLADRDDILALSPDAVKRFAYLRKEAVGLPSVRPVAENILALQPDLVVRSYGGGPNAATFFKSAGIEVLQLGYASDLASMRQLVIDMANGLGRPERGAALVAEIDRRLAALPAPASKQRALYVTPGGVTSGTGTMIDELITRAGFENFVPEPGWRSLPLERLAYGDADVLLSAFYESRSQHSSWWSVTRHSMLRAHRTRTPVVDLDGAWLTCGGWFMLDAIEAMADARARH
jgi:iron complex transport system substrate-binding protein